MSVIADVRIPADEFELGRILQVEGVTTITLETMVPLGQKPFRSFPSSTTGASRSSRPFGSTPRSRTSGS